MVAMFCGVGGSSSAGKWVINSGNPSKLAAIHQVYHFLCRLTLMRKALVVREFSFGDVIIWPPFVIIIK